MIRIDIEKQLKDASGFMQLSIHEVIEDGTFLFIYGASGAGKTSFLRILSGLMAPDTGEIQYHDNCWHSSSKRIDLKPGHRDIGFVFQDYALFPNMTVRENLEYALAKKSSKSQIDEIIELMEIGALQYRKPQTLSGGQKQRVAIARTLVQKPKILLLDEPLAALDYNMQKRLQNHLIESHKRLGLTTVMISHNIAEIIHIGSYVWCIENGRIIKKGTPIDIFSPAKSSGEFQFLGEIVSIEKQDIIYVVRMLIGNEIVKVIADKTEIEDFKPGDKVIAASKAFNPILRKV